MIRQLAGGSPPSTQHKGTPFCNPFCTNGKLHRTLSFTHMIWGGPYFFFPTKLDYHIGKNKFYMIKLQAQKVLINFKISSAKANLIEGYITEHKSICLEAKNQFENMLVIEKAS